MKVNCLFHNNPPQTSILSQKNLDHVLPSYLISILTLSTHLLLGLSSSPFSSGFTTSPVYISFLPVYATFPTHPILDLIAWLVFGSEYKWKVLLLRTKHLQILLPHCQTQFSICQWHSWCFCKRDKHPSGSYLLLLLPHTTWVALWCNLISFHPGIGKYRSWTMWILNFLYKVIYLCKMCVGSTLLLLRFRSSRMLCCVTELGFPDVSKEHSAFFFRDKDEGTVLHRNIWKS